MKQETVAALDGAERYWANVSIERQSDDVTGEMVQGPNATELRITEGDDAGDVVLAANGSVRRGGQRGMPTSSWVRSNRTGESGSS